MKILLIYLIKMYGMLTSMYLFANKSLTISMFSFSTAKYNNVLKKHKIISLEKKII